MSEKPEGKNKLSTEKLQLFIRHMESKGLGKMSCEMCQKGEWEVQAHMVAPPVFGGGGYIAGGVAYPQVMIVCKNCGNTKYVNAIMAGVVEERKQEGKDAR